MATTYLVTGQDTGRPRLDPSGTLTGKKVGDTFTATLDGTLEAKLIGGGLIAIEPLPYAVTSAGTPDASGKVLTSTASGSNEGAWLPASGGGGSPLLFYVILRNGVDGNGETVPAGQSAFVETWVEQFPSTGLAGAISTSGETITFLKDTYVWTVAGLGTDSNTSTGQVSAVMGPEDVTFISFGLGIVSVPPGAGNSPSQKEPWAIAAGSTMRVRFDNQDTVDALCYFELQLTGMAFG